MKLLRGLSSLFKPCSPTTPSPSPTAQPNPTFNPDSSNLDVRDRLQLAVELDRRRVRERTEVKKMVVEDDGCDVYVFFATSWLNSWNDFLRGGPLPGPISFSDLLTPQGKIRRDLIPERDYRVISFPIWDYLQSQHTSDPPLVSSSDDIHSAILLTTSQDSPDSPDSVLTEVNYQSYPQSDFDSAPTIRPYHPQSPTDGLVGLANPGFFCYMNASLQCLFAIEPFRDFFYFKRHTEFNSKAGKLVSEALSEVIYAVFSAEQGYYRPLRMWNMCQRRFSTMKMHDAGEFLHYLLDSVDSELGKKQGKRGLIGDTFMGKLRSNVRCLECGKVTSVDEDFVELALPLAKHLNKAFELFTAEEDLSEGYDCVYCQDQTCASKHISLLHSPNYLFLSIKRFRQYPSPQKSFQHIKFHKRISVPR